MVLLHDLPLRFNSLTLISGAGDHSKTQLSLYSGFTKLG